MVKDRSRFVNGNTMKQNNLSKCDNYDVPEIGALTAVLHCQHFVEGIEPAALLLQLSELDRRE